MRGRAAAALTVLLAAASPAGAQEAKSALELPRVVRQLDFEGNRALTDEMLAAAIGTTNSSWFARAPLVRGIGLGEKRYFDEQEFRRDVVRLEVLYRRAGYPHVEIDTILRRTPENIFVTLRIREGEPIRVTSLSVTGLDSLPFKVRQTTLVDLPLRVGDPFNRYLMQATADTITRRLRDRGYPSARVFSSFDVNRETEVARVGLETVPGESAVVGEIEITGTQRIEPLTVRNLLVARPGRVYSQDELLQSQRNLYSSDLFRYASVNLDSARFQPGDPAVPLLVQVNESRTRRIRSSFGYGTDDCFRLSAVWTTRNFLGSGGRILELTGRASKVGVGRPVDWGLDQSICSASRDDSVGSAKVNFNLGMSVRRPAFLSPNNTIAVSLFSERRSEFKAYLREETGTGVTFRRETPKRRIPMRLAYTLSYGHTEATPESFCASFNACTPEVVAILRQNNVLATLSGTVTIPKLNSPIDPSRGSQTSFELTLSSKYLGSSSFQQFVRTVAEYAWYRPVGRSSVLSWRLRGGAIFAPQVDVATETGNFIPPEQRFYAGGANDVRGYDRNELGPLVYTVSKGEVDSAATEVRPINPDRVSVNATGGNTLAIGNLELRVPSPVFTSRLRLAAFVDAGSLWERGSVTNDKPTLRMTPGVGIRFGTPLGPVRLDVAYNPNSLQAGPLYQVDSTGALTAVPGQDAYVKERSSKINWHFAVGQAF